MEEGQLGEFNHLVEMQKELTKGSINYWNQYSSYGDWHFWFMVVLTILPLIVLFLFIDRRRMFQLGFFGFSIHILHSYIDIAAVHLGKWTYPYKLIPFYPISFTLDGGCVVTGQKFPLHNLKFAKKSTIHHKKHPLLMKQLFGLMGTSVTRGK